MATQIKTGLIANDAITDAKIANVALTGVTASSGDSSTSLATTAFVATEINSLIDSAPGALNTLNELAAAMGDDANFSTTVTNSIATKLPLAGGTMTGSLVMGDNNITQINKLEILDSADNNRLEIYGNASNGFIFDMGGTGSVGTINFNDFKVGINTSATDGMLTIKKTGSNIFGDSAITIQSADSNQSTLALGLTSSVAYVDSTESGSGTVLPLVFATGSTEKMRIDSSGKIEIGNNIPMWSGEYGGALFLKGNNSTADRFAEITTVDSNGATTGTGLVVKGAGATIQVGIGTNSPIRLLDLKDQGTGDPGIRLESQSYSMDVITLRNGDGRVGFGGDAITVNQSGNVGIGAIPKITEAGWTNLSVGGQGALINSTSANAGGRTQLSNNVYVDESGNYSYISTDQASLYKQIDGIHSWHSAGSGSANAHITMSERMRIHNNGKVGFSANGMGDVSTIPRDFAFFTEGATNGVEIRSNDQRLMMLGAGGSGGAGSDDGYLTMSSQGTAKLWLSANGSSVFNGGAVGINRTPSVNNSKLEVGGADNVPLIVAEASGFYGGIGANGSTGKSRGLQIFAGANIVATFNNQTNVAYTSDGLFAANARPQRINCTGSGQMLFGYTDSGSGLYSAAMGMEFDEHNGQNPPVSQWVDGWVMKALVSGTKTLRIETDGDIYNVNGTFSSGSDRRIKKEISDASSQWNDVKAVRVRKFKLGATEAGSPHDHFHIGVIAQEIEEAGMNGLVKETTPDDGHIKFNPSLAGDKIKTVKYSILQMKAFKALQEAMEKIETLEAKVAALEAE